MKQIASIYFAAVKAVRPLYGGYYEIPAVPKTEDERKAVKLPSSVSLGPDGTFILNVPDMIQRSQEPSPDGKTKVLQRYLISARDIAVDILSEWTRQTVGMTAEAGPGIWVVRDEIPETHDGSDPKLPSGLPKFDADGRPMWRPATDEEKREMWEQDFAAAKARDANWAQWLIADADVKAGKDEQLYIGPMAKTACRAYGHDREWLQDLKDNDTKVCSYCTKRIASQAVKCPNCHEIVNPEKYAAMQANLQATVAAQQKGVVVPPIKKTA